MDLLKYKYIQYLCVKESHGLVKRVAYDNFMLQI